MTLINGSVGLLNARLRTIWRLRAFQWVVAQRLRVQILLDAAAWCAGVIFACLARFDFAVGRVNWRGVWLFLPLVVLAQAVAGLAFGLYLGRWRFGSFDEVSALAKAVASATAASFLIDIFVTPRGAHLVPISATIAGGFAALVLMAGARYTWRLALESVRRPNLDTAHRLLVFGAGDGGHQVLGAMLRDPDSPYVPVALLDDSPRKRNLRLMGVPVVGGREHLGDAARRYGADTLLIAIPSGGHDLVSELNDLALAEDLQVKVLPPVGEIFGGVVGVGDIRDVTVEDLLGRHEIETDIDAIAGYLTGKRVLVTGAGGSIGSELCRQIYRLGPAELVMLDRDESALHAVQLSIEGRAMLNSRNLVLCNIRDRRRLEEVFDEHRPQVVFHAAALKHLPLLELHPMEAVKSNVGGTLRVLEAAAAVGVERFVNISTDKAADPTSVLGYTKRIAERVTAHFGCSASGTYLSVRFGNVLNSRGSVLDTFRAQIELGGPVTITDPDVTRFFMTIPEAVQLVIQAGAIGHDGEALVLDMGQPVRIDDVARRLIAQASRPVKIVYTGLRPGEKMHEVLFGTGEPDHRPVHELISHVPVEPLEPSVAAGLAELPTAAVVGALEALCTAGSLRSGEI